MMPDDWKAQLSGMDAIFFGAVGWPATVPTTSRCGVRCSSSAANSTSTSTCAPCACLKACPALAYRKPGDIDYYVVRENTEGEYIARRRDVRRHRP